MKQYRSPQEKIRKTLLVAHNTVREIRRDRAYWLFFILSAAVIACSSLLKLLADPAVLGNSRLLVDLDLAVIRAGGGLAAILVGAGLVRRELTGRTIWLILSQPIGRTGFLLGKYLGLAALLGFYLLVMLALLAGVLGLSGLPCPSALFLSGLLIFCELLLLGALAFFFSTFAPSLLGTILTLLLFLAGHLTPTLRFLASGSESLAARWGSTVAYYLFPNFQNFDPGLPGLSSLPGLTFGFSQLAWILAYGLSVTAIFLFLAALVFNRRREFD